MTPTPIYTFNYEVLPHTQLEKYLGDYEEACVKFVLNAEGLVNKFHADSAALDLYGCTGADRNIRVSYLRYVDPKDVPFWWDCDEYGHARPNASSNDLTNFDFSLERLSVSPISEWKDANYGLGMLSRKLGDTFVLSVLSYRSNSPVVPGTNILSKGSLSLLKESATAQQLEQFDRALEMHAWGWPPALEQSSAFPPSETYLKAEERKYNELRFSRPWRIAAKAYGLLHNRHG